VVFKSKTIITQVHHEGEDENWMVNRKTLTTRTSTYLQRQRPFELMQASYLEHVVCLFYGGVALGPAGRKACRIDEGTFNRLMLVVQSTERVCCGSGY
jgi:hypothetical protein